VTRPARILFVEPSPYPSYGGSKRVLVHLASGLDRARFDPVVLCYRAGPWSDELSRHGVPVRIADTLAADEKAGESQLGTPRWIGVGQTETGDFAWSPPRWFLRELRMTARLEWTDRAASRRLDAWVPDGVDLVHINGAMHTDYAWYHLARRRGLPFVIHEHGVWKTPAGAWRRVARAAAAVLCLTRDRMDRVRARCGDDVRVELLPNGVPPQAFAPRRTRAEVRAMLGVPTDDLMIVTAGHLQPWKGQDLAIEAAGRLAERGVRFVWMLCGSAIDPEFDRSLRARVESLGLDEQVRFLGERDDLPDLFAAADLAVHTSVLPEPFGMVVVEAMAAGTPVVGPGEGAFPDLVRDGVEGRLYAPRDANSLAATLIDVVADRSALASMGVAARARARESFRLETQIERLGEIYNRVLGTI
jgi:glycosyltransferase involved in cell wall biosynthesis